MRAEPGRKPSQSRVLRFCKQGSPFVLIQKNPNTQGGHSAQTRAALHVGSKQNRVYERRWWGHTFALHACAGCCNYRSSSVSKIIVLVWRARARASRNPRFDAANLFLRSALCVFMHRACCPDLPTPPVADSDAVLGLEPWPKLLPKDLEPEAPVCAPDVPVWLLGTDLLPAAL